MKVDILLGLQWGDEGKGKIVDVLSPQYDVIARFQGGPNAGHSLEFNGEKHVLHSIPSGVFRESTTNIIGNGVVIDPSIFIDEYLELKNLGVDLEKRLKISKKAHLILPTHRIIDAACEADKGKSKIGSTLKGIGPTYMDKTARNGLRVGDILAPDFQQKYQRLLQRHKKLLAQYEYRYQIEEEEEKWFEGIDLLKSLSLIDGEYEINQYIKAGKRILAEGAQGTLLDVDFGSYPFVTSSNTIAAGASTGLGISPDKFGRIIGIFKAYCTRVGSGPFPTELHDKDGEKLQKEGHEFGATTGRPRRCGWLDLIALKYAIMLNGVTDLVMTKADVLNNFSTIKIAKNYRFQNREIDYVPYNISQVEPLWNELKGWQTDISGSKEFEDFPEELVDYIQYIENFLKIKIKTVSIGADREATVYR